MQFVTKDMTVIQTVRDVIPAEDYNEANDYSFGMKDVLRTLSFVTAASIVFAMGWIYVHST